MAITINGSGTVTGLSAGGLPDGSITTDDIASGAVTAAKLAAGAGGKILQVVSTTKTDTFSSASLGWLDVPGLNASITPSSSSNKVLVLVQLVGNGTSGLCRMAHRLVRGSTPISIGDAAGSRSQTSGSQLYLPDVLGVQGSVVIFLDSPSATTSLTYKTQVLNTNNVSLVYVNRSSNDNNNLDGERSVSSITLLEVAG